MCSLDPPFKFHFLLGSIRVGLLWIGTILLQEQRISLLPIWGMVFSHSLPAWGLSNILGALLKVQLLNAEAPGRDLNVLCIFYLVFTLLSNSAP